MKLDPECRGPLRCLVVFRLLTVYHSQYDVNPIVRDAYRAASQPWSCLALEGFSLRCPVRRGSDCDKRDTVSLAPSTIHTWCTNRSTSLRTRHTVHQRGVRYSSRYVNASSLTWVDRVGRKAYWVTSALPVLVSQWFAPTKFVVTVEGSTSQHEFFEKDSSGNVVKVKLPPKLILMSNHQVRQIRGVTASIADADAQTANSSASGVHGLAIPLVLHVLCQSTRPGSHNSQKVRVPHNP